MAASSDLQDSVEYARTLAANRLGPGARIIFGVGGWTAEAEARAVAPVRISAENLQKLIAILETLSSHAEPRS